MRFFFFLLVLSALTWACSTSQKSQKTGKADRGKTEEVTDSLKEEKIPSYQTLDQYLRTFPGVTVRGSGSSATILIRNKIQSITQDNSPLFVLDGIQIGRDFSQVYDRVPTEDIASVRVLKDPAQLSFYGQRGANGVILIKTKKGKNKDEEKKEKKKEKEEAKEKEEKSSGDKNGG